MKLEPNAFSKKVFTLIKSIPKGQVATYGQIAALAGKPHGARGVGWLLHSSSIRQQLPWHRVLNSQGKISFDPQSSNFRLQKLRLENEGVEFSESNRLNLACFQWKKKYKEKKNSRLPTMF